jgi:hypothetical protein
MTTIIVFKTKVVGKEFFAIKKESLAGSAGKINR